MKKKGLIAVGLLLFIGVKGQQLHVPLHRDYSKVIEQKNIEHKAGLHTAIKPFRYKQVNTLFGADSTLHLNVKNVVKKEGEIGISALPLFFGGLQNTSNVGVYNLGASLALQLNYTPNLSAKIEYIPQFIKQPEYLNMYSANQEVIAGFGRYDSIGNTLFNQQLLGQVNYAAGKYFVFEAGNGKHFFGEGYRSMFLSDNAAAYPYLKVNTQFWKVKYVNLFTAMQHFRQPTENGPLKSTKYTSMHYLSWEAFKGFNIAVFEAVIWQGNDIQNTRGFDVNYLNPVIFYRPVEFGLGSADNVLLGTALRYNFKQKYQVYSQLLLDEFLLDELRAKSGWWANKFAIQIGAKAFNVIPNTTLQAEFNIARPFTYSHGSIQQNYAHKNQPLAHPLGANFSETVLLAEWQKNKWGVSAQYNYAVYGEDSSAFQNFGGDVFQSYSNRYQDFGNTIGQGIQNELHFIRAEISYKVNEKDNIKAFVAYTLRINKVDALHYTNSFIGIGFKANIFNQYTDF